MNPEQITQLIQSSIPDADVSVSSDDNVHFTATVFHLPLRIFLNRKT